MSETTTEGTSPVRAFWPSDYKRFSQAVRTARKEQGDTVAAALAAPIVDALSADNPEFDAERFMAATYAVPAYVGALSNALKTLTHVKCSPWTPASDDKLAKVAALGTSLTETLASDVPGFKAEIFAASFTPPVRSGTVDPDDEDDDPDDDEDY